MEFTRPGRISKLRDARFEDTQFGSGIILGTGDSFVRLNVVPAPEASSLMDKIKSEVTFKSMSHKGGLVPRLIANQGVYRSLCFPVDAETSLKFNDADIGLVPGCHHHTIDDNIILEPIYRHPMDDDIDLQEMTPTVLMIKNHIEILTNQSYNHVLIQYYRSGEDYISEHSDKTLDIAIGSKIVNFSIGATRQFFLKQKKDSPLNLVLPNSTKDVNYLLTEKIPLPHNSLFVLGWDTNRHFVHGIKQDKRLITLKADDELIYDCQRISLTFRCIETFRCRGRQLQSMLFGQGSPRRIPVLLPSDSDIKGIHEGHEEDKDTEVIQLLQAFSAENKTSMFDWDENYGRGFDVINISI